MQYPQGERIYRTYCANCHMPDGSGLAALIPPLAGSPYLRVRNDEVPCLIRYGSSEETLAERAWKEPMPGFSNLNETELSNLINYINTAWGNNNALTNPEEIAEQLARCER